MISVIVPIYNVELYLRQCIESVCNQTFKDLEIILVDDGSTDSSGKICDEFAKKDKRIIVIHQENQGLVNARKAGLEAASKAYISYVDGDDWIEPNMYDELYQKITRESVDVVMCGHYNDTGDIKTEVFCNFVEKKYSEEELMNSIYPQMLIGEEFFEWKLFPSLWAKLFRREKFIAFQMNVDPRITIGEDAACTFPYFLNINGICIVNKCLYHYRQHASSMIKRIQDRSIERLQFQVLYRTVKKSLEEYAVRYDLREQWRRFMLFMMVPRSDNLYQGFDKLDYLFPFPQVKRGANIALYCAGTFGQRLYSYIQKTGFCHIGVWVDRNFRQLQNMGLPVEDPGRLSDIDAYDAIVVANMFEHSRKAIYCDLVERYSQKTICLLDKELIFSKETALRFGLSE